MSPGTFDVLKGEAVRLWVAVVAIVAIALLEVGLWALNTATAVTVDITECGFDSKGAYAKFRINNSLLGGADARRQVFIDFSVEGSHPKRGSHFLPGGDYPYGAGSTAVALPAHGHVTGVVHGGFPPRGLHVEGRTVYVLGRQSGYVSDVRLVTEKVAQDHRPGGVRVETVPGDPGSLHCSYVDDGF